MAGLKKQFNKARQLLSEKICRVKGTKLEEEFVELERKSWVTNKCVTELVSKTKNYFRINPVSRGKVPGQVTSTSYPQAEGLLGDCMLRYGHELGEDSLFGCALVDSGKAMDEIAGLKYTLDIDIKQNFIDPLQNLQKNDLAEIMHQLKKMEGRRLDMDFKKTREEKFSTEEIQKASNKFEESHILAEESMVNFLENVDQVNHLSALITATSEYHRQSQSILEELSMTLKERISMSSQHPKSDFEPMSSASNNSADHMAPIHSFCVGSQTPIESLHQSEELGKPCCRSLYDYQPRSKGDLALKAGDLLILTDQFDEYWYEGMLNGVSGFFPINYVEVILPLPV